MKSLQRISTHLFPLFLLSLCLLSLTACHTVPSSENHTHTFALTSETPATCLENGLRQYQCTCGETKEELIVSTGHHYVVNVLSYATKDSAGEEQRVCQNCNDTVTISVPKITNPTGSFSTPYVTIDQAMTYRVFSGQNEISPEQLKFSWILNNIRVSTQNTYTPVATCLTQTLRVQVKDHNGNVLANDSLYCSRLPVIFIETENGAAITSKTEFLNATASMQGCMTFPNETTTLYQGKLKIRGRGNSTWNLAEFKKKAYKLKLDTSTDLFGFGKSKHWTLIANFIDESLLRNKLAYDTAAALGNPSMQSTWVELILNGKPQGVYQLCEQIKISSSRVDIYNWEDTAEDLAKAVAFKNQSNGFTKKDRNQLEEQLCTDLSWIATGTFQYQNVTYRVKDFINLPNRTGGFLIELSQEYDEISKFKTKQGVPIMFKNPEYISTSSVLFDYAKEYIQAFEDALYANNFKTTYKGKEVSWLDFVDAESLAQFFLVSDFFKNEIGYKSTYMYLDIDGKLTFGPVWDFDFAAGSNSPWGTQTTSGWHCQSRPWFSRMMKDPEFAKVVFQVYPTFQEQIQKILVDGGIMDTAHDYLKEAAAQNSALWFYKRGFEEDFSWLKDWITYRLKWYAPQFTDLSTLTQSLGGNPVKVDDSGNILPGDIGVNAPQKIPMALFDSANRSIENYGSIPKGTDKILLHVDVVSTAAFEIIVYINGKRLDTFPIRSDRTVEVWIETSMFKANAENTILIVANRNNGHSPYNNSMTIKCP